MCTVVVRWASEEPVRVLALRDELTSRAFDDPGQWWPDQPGVVGGRDRVAGGTWCASDVAAGVTALVLNRPQKRGADPGAPSRGVLPLLGVAHGADWPRHVQVEGMASFAMVVAEPGALGLWEFDGTELVGSALGPGTHMVTSGRAEDGKVDRYLSAFQGADDWRGLVQRESPHDDPAALVVRHPVDDVVFATVFGQLIEQEPGRLHLEHARRPWTDEPWTVQDWPAGS